jgi:hypothetical protein
MVISIGARFIKLDQREIIYVAAENKQPDNGAGAGGQPPPIPQQKQQAPIKNDQNDVINKLLENKQQIDEKEVEEKKSPVLATKAPVVLFQQIVQQQQDQANKPKQPKEQQSQLGSKEESPIGPKADDIEFLKNLERIVHIDLKGAPPRPDYFKYLNNNPDNFN